MPTPILHVLFTAVLVLLASFATAEESSNAPVSQPPAPQIAITQQAPPASLPDWMYKELIAIQKDVSVLDATGASKAEIQALKERISKIEVQLTTSQNRVEDKLTEHRQRIGDINSNVSQIGWIVSIVFTIIIGLSVYLSFNSKEEAKAVAKTEAERQTKVWLEDNSNHLNEQLLDAKTQLDNRIKEDLLHAKKQIDAFVSEGKKEIEGVRSKVHKLEKIIAEIGNPESISSEDKQEIDGAAKQTATKPNDERNINDWKLLATDAYLNKEYEKSLSFTNEIFNTPDLTLELTDLQSAQLLFLKSLSLGKLNRFEEEITVYDQLITRFQDNQATAIREQVAKAMNNKGFRLGKLKRSEKAITVYDQLISRFQGSENSDIKKSVRSAIANKAELVLLTHDVKATKQAITEAISYIGKKPPVNRAIMEMFSFMINDTSETSVLSFINLIPDDANIGWTFNEVRPMIEKLKSPRKKQVEAFVRFFEEHKNKQILKAELDEISKSE